MGSEDDSFYYVDDVNKEVLSSNILFQKIVAGKENLTSDYILGHKKRLERILADVSRKVSEQILSHQPSCISELQRIMNLQKSITDSIRICTQSRACLRSIKEGPSRNGTTIVEHYKRRRSLAKLLASLTAMNEMRKSVLEIKELIICREDFSRALELYRDCKARMPSFELYKCATELDSRLSDTVRLIGEQVGIVLSRMCLSYNPDTYVKLQALFCECATSQGLRDYITAQALDFFNAYHKSSMDELAMFLENELWEMLPVKHDFKLVHLKEFSFLRSPTEDDYEFDLELETDYLDEDEFTSAESRYLLTGFSGPVLTNSSLNVLRLFGRYIQMMSVLEPISYEILMNIYKLLDHYIMFVYRKFGPEKDQNLRAVIRSIRENLICKTVVNEDAASQGVSNISNMLNSDLSTNTPVDQKKAVAIESLIFLVNQLWNLQEYLETLIPSHLRPQLREQFSQSQSIVPDFLKARAEMNSDIVQND